jgi:chorismate synthase
MAPASRPARARGLKQQVSVYSRQNPCVAPRAGAWIEAMENKKIL